MKVVTKTTVDIPDIEVYKTILKWLYECNHESSDGWEIYGNFDRYMEFLYNQAMDKTRLKVNFEKQYLDKLVS